MTRVLLADDQGLVRAGFRALLDAQPDIEVVGEAADGAEAVELAAARAARRRADGRADAAHGRPRGDAADHADPGLAGTRVVVLTTFELDEYVFGALRAGASGFLLKDIDPPDLLSAVRVVADGEALLAPRLTRRLIEAFVAQERAAPRPSTEATRSRSSPRASARCSMLVGRGLSNTEIADELVLSPLTAKTHVARLFQKLDARDRAQLVVLAYETGLVVPGER